jgi:hypothetical protein
LTVADNSDCSWRSQNLKTLGGVYADKQVGGKQGQNDFDMLPILPYMRAFPGGKKGLDTLSVKVLH